ncbi:hypothetical protein Zmor_008466 [Zophobas morio]|uniref:Uncharacterized protein n=1 Tax=Zophobas morio TaxID=2755281 RepID=A0AA38MQU3_9CUCU|nr:hypothetical protein Zmor_008466 [Zophobas morio]
MKNREDIYGRHLTPRLGMLNTFALRGILQIAQHFRGCMVHCLQPQHLHTTETLSPWLARWSHEGWRIVKNGKVQSRTGKVQATIEVPEGVRTLQERNVFGVEWIPQTRKLLLPFVDCCHPFSEKATILSLCLDYAVPICWIICFQDGTQLS